MGATAVIYHPLGPIHRLRERALTPTVWFMTTGEAGFRTQARGLATAIAADARELVVDLRTPWRYLPGDLSPAPFAALTPGSDRLHPPWPDLLVSCGRRATALSIAVRKASGGRTVTVHVQDPLTRPSAFDLIVAMAHDPVSGPNVLKAPTALHDVTAEKLAAAAQAWRGRLAVAGQPLVGVVLGGATRRQAFTPLHMQGLIAGLTRLQREAGARLAITPSRRTPDEVRALLATRFGGDADAWLWEGEGDNPYLGILGLADRLVVTSDSVSMISEALATSAAVEIFGAAGNARHAQFLDGLVARGQVRRFEGDPVPGLVGGPIDATAAAAAAVRQLLAARTGVAG
jgi:mitochondrial fission protein ELM1